MYAPSPTDIRGQHKNSIYVVNKNDEIYLAILDFKNMLPGQEDSLSFQTLKIWDNQARRPREKVCITTPGIERVILPSFSNISSVNLGLF